MKTKILSLLRDSKDYVSGQELCEKLSVSRTAVWKVIHQLKEEGYQFDAIQNKGYKMIAEPDLMTKSEIVSRLETTWAGREIQDLKETDSTNADCKRLAEQGAGHGLLCVADSQREGRGRRGKSWESPPGTSISMSLLLKPGILPEQAPMLTIVMALAVARAINELGEEPCQIKWPNDILFHNRKVCGILTEMSAEMDFINYVVIGCGVNVNQEEIPLELQEIATSLKREMGTLISRAKLVARILYFFEKVYNQFTQQGNLSFLQVEYNNLLVNRSRQVRVLDPQGEYNGTAIGINETGELLVETEDGKQIAVYAGEVSVRGIYGYV